MLREEQCVLVPEGDFPETTEKIPAMRRAIAKAMVNSKHTAPHVKQHKVRKLI
jgi:pyruvate/2-oxoglutarate dehydrogenase complex dihydrolipoamide acyltransferase (E2) component